MRERDVKQFIRTVTRHYGLKKYLFNIKVKQDGCGKQAQTSLNVVCYFKAFIISYHLREILDFIQEVGRTSGRVPTNAEGVLGPQWLKYINL